MELNREQAIEILERFDFFQGQRAGRELWNGKPFEVQEQDIAKFSQDVGLLKNYINELVKEQNALTRMLVARAEDISRLTEENEARKRCNTMLNNELRRIDNIKTDTVRKMQKALEHRIHSKLSYHGWYLKETMIAEIAKELLGEQDNES